MDFYPRPPRGGRQTIADLLLMFGKFLSTPSARRATDYLIDYAVTYAFLSTPSARRATDYRSQTDSQKNISIHALPEEGDQQQQASIPEKGSFLSTPSARRATMCT